MKHFSTYNTSYHAWTMVRQFLPNPDTVLQRRGQSITIYRELLSDSHLSAVLDSRSAGTLSSDWTIDRNECPARLCKIVKEWFFNILERKSAVDDLSRDETIDNLMDVVYWGYQPAELTWGFESGMWLPTQIVPKPPEWFQWFIPESGIPEIRFLSQAHPVEGERPPDDFTIICPRVKPSYDNPYGRGVAGRCFWPVVFKRAGMEFWLNFMERFAIPWVVGKTNSTDSTKLKEFATDLKQLVQDAVIAISGTDKTVELLEAKSANNSGFEALCNFMDAQMSKAVLGHTLSTDASEKGSYAAVRGALTVRADIRDRDIKLMKSTFNDVINLIFVRNGFVNVPRPTLRQYRESDVNLLRAQRDEALHRTGIRFSKDYYARTYRFEQDDITEIKDPLDFKQVSGIEDVKETSTTPGGLKDKQPPAGT